MTAPHIVFDYEGARRYLVWASSFSMAAAWVDQLNCDAGRTETKGYTVFTLTPAQDGTVIELETSENYDPDILESMFGRPRSVVLR